VAPGDVPAVAVPDAATLVHPPRFAGAGPHARQYSSEHVSPSPQSAPEEQHLSASCPHEAGSPPVVVVVVVVGLSVALVAPDEPEPPHPATPKSGVAVANAAQARVLVEIMTSSKQFRLLGDT
jgi:hypothetical protein